MFRASHLGQVSCMRQGMLTLSGAPSTTSHLDIYILSIFLLFWQVLLANARWLSTSWGTYIFIKQHSMETGNVMQTLLLWLIPRDTDIVRVPIDSSTHYPTFLERRAALPTLMTAHGQGDSWYYFCDSLWYDTT